MSGLQQELIGRLDAALTAWHRPQKSLAKAVGISEKHLSQILNAKAWPTPGLWDRLLFEAEHWPKAVESVGEETNE
jgi:transcriptional regulator with XRE-family HTH domain